MIGREGVDHPAGGYRNLAVFMDHRFGMSARLLMLLIWQFVLQTPQKPSIGAASSPLPYVTKKPECQTGLAVCNSPLAEGRISGSDVGAHGVDARHARHSAHRSRVRFTRAARCRTNRRQSRNRRVRLRAARRACRESTAVPALLWLF